MAWHPKKKYIRVLVDKVSVQHLLKTLWLFYNHLASPQSKSSNRWRFGVNQYSENSKSSNTKSVLLFKWKQLEVVFSTRVLGCKTVIIFLVLPTLILVSARMILFCGPGFKWWKGCIPKRPKRGDASFGLLTLKLYMESWHTNAEIVYLTKKNHTIHVEDMYLHEWLIVHGFLLLGKRIFNRIVPWKIMRHGICKS